MIGRVYYNPSKNNSQKSRLRHMLLKLLNFKHKKVMWQKGTRKNKREQVSLGLH